MADDAPSDLDLVLRANAGDARAFEALYERYRDWILRSARAVTGREDLAADVLQDVVLYWLGLFPGFTLQGKVTSFLHPCVRHASLEVLRRRGIVVEAAPRDAAAGSSTTRGFGAEPPGAPPTEAPTRARVEVDELRRAVDALPLEQREVLHLAVTEGVSMPEIAKSIGVPVGTVKSRLHHALAKLRENDSLRKSFFD